ncbi:PREDICTED: tctex1 domain-containing protein 1-A-like [Branchiostoma belcheri]|uniref:Tctex1 domain-containing protein 1-A-like n=1 Tax=Branchiostoma belcheri TaxID=7741 RepID=A0A6P4Y1W6_BRABE|nr:PREDICTED: tctex1 domain-containing protein 1-A-like [Branchiostoma belcheri]
MSKASLAKRASRNDLVGGGGGGASSGKAKQLTRRQPSLASVGRRDTSSSFGTVKDEAAKVDSRQLYQQQEIDRGEIHMTIAGVSGAGKTSQEPAPPSPVNLRSLMVTKRLAMNFKRVAAQRVADKKGASYLAHTDRPWRPQHPRPPEEDEPEQEHTYQLGPVSKFFTGRAEKALSELLEERLCDYTYNSGTAGLTTKNLCEEAKKRMKEFLPPRYKLISVANIGERQCQDIRVASRCAWDPSVDTFASATFENGSVFCVATVYAVYME